MDERFNAEKGGRPQGEPVKRSRNISDYYEQRSKRVQNFTLKMDGEPDGGLYGSRAGGSDIYSYGKGEADRKKDDYMELQKSRDDSDYAPYGYSSQPSYTRGTPPPTPPRPIFTIPQPGQKVSEVQPRPAQRPTDGGQRPPFPGERPYPYDQRQGAAQGTAGRQPSSEGTRQAGRQPSYGETRPTGRQPSSEGERPPQRRPAPQGTRPTEGKSARPSDGESRRRRAGERNAPSQKNAAKKPSAGKKKAGGKKLKGYSAVVTVLGFLCAIVFIASVTAAVSTFVISAIDDILSINTDKTVVTVTVPENADPDQIIDLLSANGVVRQKLVCKFFAKFRHFDGYVSSKTGEFVKTEYAPGIYYVEKDDGIESILNSMKVGYGASSETVTVSFPEGWTVAQIFEKLEKKEVCEAAILYANLDITAQQYDFYAKLPTDATRYQKLEGYLFPDTYEFYVGENPNSVLKKLFDNFEDKLTSEYRKRAKELGLTTDQVITIASIVQREGTSMEQMRLISSVIHNRLNNASAFPLLQCDSTSTYAANYIVPNVDSYYGQLYSEAYNTYSSEGLTPGPICNPGDDAINATLYPDDTNYYYFCHDPEGNMYVAETFEQHRINMAKALG